MKSFRRALGRARGKEGTAEFLWPGYLDLTVLTTPTGAVCHFWTPVPLSLGQGHPDGEEGTGLLYGGPGGN